jgi:4-oxalocrotonate tautomerase
MPFVSIKIIEGRNTEQKRGMVKDVTEAIVKNIGCPTDAVQIEIVEMIQENIGQGGKLFCDTHK